MVELLSKSFGQCHYSYDKISNPKVMRYCYLLLLVGTNLEDSLVMIFTLLLWFNSDREYLKGILRYICAVSLTAQLSFPSQPCFAGSNKVTVAAQTSSYLALLLTFSTEAR